MKKITQQVNINHRVLPVFADRSVTVSHVASVSGRNRKKALRKEGTIRLIFIDGISNSSVADVVLTSIGAEQLVKGINRSLEKLKKDLADPNIPQHKHHVPDQAYIG
jgi:hypothetical protein